MTSDDRLTLDQTWRAYEHSRSAILDWHKRFVAGPKIYGVRLCGEIVNYYESREAAELEVEWSRKHGEKATIVTLCVHTLELARERWV